MTADRISRTVATLEAAWRRTPHLRLGQLITNALPQGQSDPYYVEDEILCELLAAYPDTDTVIQDDVAAAQFFDEWGRPAPEVISTEFTSQPEM